MRSYPKQLFVQGNADLLQRPLVSIVGSRRPSPYSLQLTQQLAARLVAAGMHVVSGAAMGIDAAAHRGAGSANTIAVMANGLDIRYPKINQYLIQEIETKGLVLSAYEPGFTATRWSFVQRNEIVAALGGCLIVTHAERNSGTLHSVAFARAMGKPVYVIPQRLDESEGTNDLLHNGDAEAIYDMDAFVAQWAPQHDTAKTDDPILAFCETRPSYEAAVAKFGAQIMSYELEGKITVVAGHVVVV